LTDVSDGIKKKHEDLLSYIFLALLAAIIFILRLKFITLPMDRDEGAYAYVAWRMDFHELPYRDIFDHKPPVIYFIYRLAFLMFGQSYTAIRGFTIFYVVAIMLAVFFTVKKMAGTKQALISAALYSFYQSSVFFQGINSNTEIFASLFLIFSFYCTVNLRERPLPYAFLAGLFFSAAFFIKESVFLAGAATLIWWIFKKTKKEILFAYISGFLVFSAIIFIWLAANGILKDFMKWGVSYNLHYIKGSFNQGLFIFKLFVIENTLHIIGILALVFILFKKKFNDDNTLYLFIYILSLGLGIFILRGEYQHYYLFLYPFMCMATGWLINYLFLKNYKISASICAAAIFAVTFVFNNVLYYFMNANEASYWQYLGDNEFAEASIISDYINAIKKPGNELFAWPGYPQIYFLTKIKSQVKQINVLPAYRRFDPDGVHKAIEYAKKNKPTFIAVYSSMKTELGTLFDNYKLLVKGESVELYYRK